MPERAFQIGDVVEINNPSYKKWHRRRGHVVQAKGNVMEDYVAVDIPGSDFGIGGWLPESLILVDEHAEAVAVLGEGYFA